MNTFKTLQNYKKLVTQRNLTTNDY